MSQYKIIGVVYICLSAVRNHIPYFKALVVEGPRGGRIVVDEFNSEIVLSMIERRVRGGNSILSTINGGVLFRYAKATNKLVVVSTDVALNEIAKRFGAKTVLSRRSGMETAKNIGTSFGELDMFMRNMST